MSPQKFFFFHSMPCGDLFIPKILKALKGARDLMNEGVRKELG